MGKSVHTESHTTLLRSFGNETKSPPPLLTPFFALKPLVVLIHLAFIIIFTQTNRRIGHPRSDSDTQFVLQSRQRTKDGGCSEILAPYFRYGIIDRCGQQGRKNKQMEETYVQRNGPLLVGHAEEQGCTWLSSCLCRLSWAIWRHFCTIDKSTQQCVYFRSIYALVTIFIGMECNHGAQLSRDRERERERHSFAAFKTAITFSFAPQAGFGHQKGLPNKQSPYFSFSFFSMQISSICKHSTLSTQWLTLRILSKQANMSSLKCPATTSSVLS